MNTEYSFDFLAYAAQALLKDRLRLRITPVRVSEDCNFYLDRTEELDELTQIYSLLDPFGIYRDITVCPLLNIQEMDDRALLDYRDNVRDLFRQWQWGKEVSQQLKIAKALAF